MAVPKIRATELILQPNTFSKSRRAMMHQPRKLSPVTNPFRSFMQKNHISASIIIPADLRPEEFAPYFSALAAWAHKDPQNLETIFRSYRKDVNSDDSASARMEFISFFFFECEAGLDFLRALRRNRLGQSAFVGNHAAPATSAN